VAKSSPRSLQRILVLSGPAGSGKSSLVKVLAKRNNLNFDIVEWKVEETQSGIDPEYYWDRGRPNGQQSDTLVEGINGELWIFALAIL
jgi:ABC-type iron transport system FetAB ATPase subunit